MIFILHSSPQFTDHNSKYCMFEKICDTPRVTCRGSVADPDLELRRVEGGGLSLALLAFLPSAILRGRFFLLRFLEAGSSFCDS